MSEFDPDSEAVFLEPAQYRAQCLGRLFGDDGRTVILPIDHGIAIPVPGLEKPADLISALSPWVDGFVVNLGIGIQCREALEDRAVILRTDAYNVRSEGPGAGSHAIFSTDDALSIGADAVMNMTFPGGIREAEILEECAQIISGSLDTGVPVIVEALPVGLGQTDAYTVDAVSFAVRQAAEIGADVVKTTYPTGASVGDLKGIIDACPVPVVMLGGAAMGDDKALLEMVGNSIEAGASGIAIGRNVWQHAAPAEILKQLHGIVHSS